MSSSRFIASRGDCRVATLLVFCYDYCLSDIVIDIDMLPRGVDDCELFTELMLVHPAIIRKN